MVDTDIVREWQQKADEDFDFALINLEEQRPFYAQNFILKHLTLFTGPLDSHDRNDNLKLTTCDNGILTTLFT